MPKHVHNPREKVSEREDTSIPTAFRTVAISMEWRSLTTLYDAAVFVPVWEIANANSLGHHFCMFRKPFDDTATLFRASPFRRCCARESALEKGARRAKE